MKFVLDQCSRINVNKLPKNTINLFQFARKIGINGTELIWVRNWADQKILDLAIENNYIVITSDSGFITRAVKQNKKIVYKDNKSGRFFFVDSIEVKLK